MKMKFTVYLKGGSKIHIKSKNIKLTRDGNGGLDAYGIEGMPANKYNLFWTRINSIDAIVKGWQ